MDASRRLDGAFAQKLEELALLMEGYDAVCARGKRDPRDQETVLLEQMEEGDFAQSHVFYIDGFPDFTRQHLAILGHMIQESEHVTIGLNCDKPDSKLLAFEKAGHTASQILRLARQANVEVQLEWIAGRSDGLAAVRGAVFQGPVLPECGREVLQVRCAQSAYQECLAAAEQIMELVQKGCRYRDIMVVCADADGYRNLVNLAFHRCGIPVYQSGNEDILQKSVISTVLCALDAALSGYENRAMMRYLRSVLSPVEPEICDLVENYAVIWGIRGNRWTEEWTNHPEGLSAVFTEQTAQQLKLLNDARIGATGPLERLRRAFSNAKSCADQVRAVYALLEDLDLENRLAELAGQMDEQGDNRSAQILNQLWDILIGALEQLYDVLGDAVWDAETFTRLFQLLLSQYDVGTIPPVLDAVQVGTVSSQRLHEQKHLIILGAMEGSLPGYSGTSGVLTDQERVALRELGVPLTGGNLEGIQAEFAEIYGVFCGARETVTLYYTGDQPSFVTRRLSEMAGGTRTLENIYGACLSNSTEAAALLVALGAPEEASRIGIGEQWQRVSGAAAYSLGAIQRQQVERLYGHTLNLSASQIDRQAECRLSYFLKYGLRAKERKEATVDPAEFGTYVHYVLEHTARTVREEGGFQTVSLDRTLEIAAHYSDEYTREHFAQLDSQRVAYLFRRNTQELKLVVQELWEELRQSQFQPEGFEVDFGSPEGLPAIAVPAQKMRAILRGFVDRVDAWHHNGNDYFRVVDYKTGKKDFDYCDVFNGVGLQMLLYLFALKETGADVVGSNPIAAGVQYFPARVPYVSADGSLDEEELEKERRKDRKRRGLLLNDREVLQAMEPGENPERLCYSTKKDGTVSGDLADREQLHMLKEYIFRILGRMVDDIASGNVEPNPYTRGTSHSACAFCPYGAICHEEQVEGRRNYKTMTAQRFWEEIGKEAARHG